MSYTNGLDKPSDYFNTVTYTGNGTARNITTGLTTTDWVWIKRRDGTANHRLTDVVRGATNMLSSNNTNATQTHAQTVTAFGTNTFSLGTDSGSYDVNTNSQTYASWNWSAGGSASSNSNGSITSTVSANTTAGFSIVSYSGASSGGSVGHGLGVKPDIVLIKCRSATANWLFTTDIIDGSKDYLFLNQTNAKGDLTTALPTSSVFTVSGDDDQGENGKTYIAYCFNSVKGYSKFGSYTGNGNADGTFVYTGFKPAWIMRKSTSRTNEWTLIDSTRSPFNQTNQTLVPNASDAEDGDFDIDILSNGFKCRTSESAHNQSGDNFIYMAFAENPFVTSTGIPTTAR